MRQPVLGALMALLSMLGSFAPSATLAQDAPCPTQPSNAFEYVDFAGPWERDGMAVEVGRLGCGTLSWGDGVGQPLGVTRFVLDDHEGLIASGYIIDDSDPPDGPAADIVLRLEDDETLSVEWPDETRIFCRPWAWDPRCEA